MNSVRIANTQPPVRCSNTEPAPLQTQCPRDHEVVKEQQQQ